MLRSLRRKSLRDTDILGGYGPMRLRNKELDSYFDGAHCFKVCHCLCGLQSHTFAGVSYCTVEEVQASVLINELRRPTAVSRT